jgi:hypothetical protein
MNIKLNPAYRCYNQAKQRCNNPNATSYKNYGAKGIKFLYESFQDFLLDVGERPSMQHTLDRIDNNKHYEIGNVKWATWVEQANNRKKPKSKFGITGVHQKYNRDSFIAYSNNSALYIGKDFFEACCVRKSWELKSINLG